MISNLQRQLELADDLWHLAQGKENLVNLVQRTATRPNQCVAAYLTAHKKLAESDRLEKLREARLYLPSETEVNPELWSRLEEAVLQESNIQPIEWPPQRDVPKPVERNEKILFLDNILKGKNPFAHEQAEDDEYYLFHLGAFWPGHDLQSHLASAYRPTIVTGPHGCGRTALALALSRYLTNRDQFALYLPGQPAIGEIQEKFTQLVLDFVKRHPTLLSWLSSAERALLARLFVATLDKAYSLAEVTAARFDFMEKRQRLATHQLTLLENAIEQVNISDRHDRAWPRELHRCTLSFKFKHLRLVLDAPNGSKAWANETILPHLRRWWADGLTTLVFISESNYPGIRDGVTRHETLTWEPDQLKAMVRWRYRNVIGDRTTIDGRFARGQFEELISHSKIDEKPNPRQWVHLWNRIIRPVPHGSDVIDADSIWRVLSEL